jgi:hypothetical protein
LPKSPAPYTSKPPYCKPCSRKPASQPRPPSLQVRGGSDPGQ